MSNENYRARAILPRTAGKTDPKPPSTESSSIAGSSRSITVSSTRTNIRSACLACRRRRSRCTGGTPCSRCRALETECIYQESQDGRTRALREKSKEELELHKKVINGVFRAVREGREEPLLVLIRSEATLETIAAAINDPNTETPSESASETPESQSFSRQEQMDVESRDYSRIYHQEIDGLSQDMDDDTIDTPFAGGRSLNATRSARLHRDILSDPLIASSSSVNGIRHMLQPLHQEDTSDLHQLSSMYVSFRDAAQSMIAQGVPPANLQGTINVSCNLLFGSRSPPYGVATCAAAVVNSAPGTDILFRLAWLCYVTRFMRWAVDPSEDHYRLMPEAMRPTSLQLSVPHAPAIDLVPIPEIRDSMIENFRDFTIAFEMAGATVLWTESIDDAIDQDPKSDNLTVSAKFESHIANVNNFCFGRSLLNVFPELNGHLQIAEQDQIVPISSGASPGIAPTDSESTH